MMAILRISERGSIIKFLRKLPAFPTYHRMSALLEHRKLATFCLLAMLVFAVPGFILAVGRDPIPLPSASARQIADYTARLL